MAEVESETALLAAVETAGEGGFDSSTLGWDAAKLVGLIKSLDSDKLLLSQARAAEAAA